MSVPGAWTIHYDWGCTGNYSQTSLTFNTNGTFTDGFGETGTWISHDGQILFQFNNTVHTTYGGAVVESAMVGISFQPPSSSGCWYAVKSTATTKTIAERKPQHKLSGDPLK